MIANRSIHLCPTQTIPTKFGSLVLRVLGHPTSPSAALSNSVRAYRSPSYDRRLDAESRETSRELRPAHHSRLRLSDESARRGYPRREAWLAQSGFCPG